MGGGIILNQRGGAMPRANPQKQHHRTGDRVNGNAFKLVFLTKERYTFHCNIHILPYLNQFHRLYNKICMDNVQKQKINKTKERNQLHRIYCCFQKRRTPNKSFQLQWKERKTAAFRDHFWNLNFELDTISLKKGFAFVWDAVKVQWDAKISI